MDTDRYVLVQVEREAVEDGFYENRPVVTSVYECHAVEALLEDRKWIEEAMTRAGFEAGEVD